MLQIHIIQYENDEKTQTKISSFFAANSLRLAQKNMTMGRLNLTNVYMTKLVFLFDYKNKILVRHSHMTYQNEPKIRDNILTVNCLILEQFIHMYEFGIQRVKTGTQYSGGFH